jgi:hypothetical protein
MNVPFQQLSQELGLWLAKSADYLKRL